MMSQDVSRTHVQTHSGQRVLKLPRRFIESAVAFCFNSQSIYIGGQDNFVVIIIAPTSFGTITSADGHISALHAVSV